MSELFNELLFLAPRYKARKRVGRGRASGHGKTCCKGGKGQTARAGFKRKAYFEGGQMPLYRRLPKWGFNSMVNRWVAVNLNQLAHSSVVSEALKSGLKVKLFGLDVPAGVKCVSCHRVSKGAEEALKAAGVEVVML